MWSAKPGVIYYWCYRVFSFANLGIQCVRRKELDASLQKRRNKNIDPFNSEYWNVTVACILMVLNDFFCFVSTAGHSKSIEDMDMNVVRLCFQCELERKDGDRIQLAPVVTNPIYDKSKNKFHFGTEILLWCLYCPCETNQWKRGCNFLPDDVWIVCVCLVRGDHNGRVENRSAEHRQRPLYRKNRDLYALWQSAKR